MELTSAFSEDGVASVVVPFENGIAVDVVCGVSHAFCLLYGVCFSVINVRLVRKILHYGQITREEKTLMGKEYMLPWKRCVRLSLDVVGDSNVQVFLDINRRHPGFVVSKKKLQVTGKNPRPFFSGSLPDLFSGRPPIKRGNIFMPDTLIIRVDANLGVSDSKSK